jgi:hypothetical protein
MARPVLPGSQRRLSVFRLQYDGFADLAIGEIQEYVGALQSAGAVNVLYGSAGGLQTASPDDQFWNQDSPEVQDTAEGNDGFGSSLGAGN